MQRGICLACLGWLLVACQGGGGSTSSQSSSSNSSSGAATSGPPPSSAAAVNSSASHVGATSRASSLPFPTSSATAGTSTATGHSSSTATASSSAAVVNPCDGVDCAGHGTCSPLGGEAVCACETGFHNEGHSCVANPPPGALCANITCNDHGVCMSDDQHAVCHCDPGYALNLTDTNCVTTPAPCDGVACNGHGTCKTAIYGGATCACDPGFTQYGNACIPERKVFCRNRDGSVATRGTARCSDDDTHREVCHDGDGDGLVEWIYGSDCPAGAACSAGCLNATCPDVPCPVGTACVTEAHGQPLGVCVPTCDCSNCGNCGGDNSDHRWDDMQEHCGAQPNQFPAVTACNLPCPHVGDGCIPYDPPICWPIEGCFSAPPVGP